MKTEVRVPAVFVIAALVSWAAWAVAAGWAVSSRWAPRALAPGDPDLGWIRHAYPSAGPAQDRIREIHARHAAEREEAARELHALSQRVLGRVQGEDRWSEALAEDIAAWDRAAARSHRRTWEYIYEVAGVLASEESRRYREEMARNILGSVPLPSRAVADGRSGGP